MNKVNKQDCGENKNLFFKLFFLNSNHYKWGIRSGIVRILDLYTEYLIDCEYKKIL